MNGNGNLCRSLVRAGARLGTMNKQGISIFNAPVATKQLLFKLLGNMITWIHLFIQYALKYDFQSKLGVSNYYFSISWDLKI